MPEQTIKVPIAGPAATAPASTLAPEATPPVATPETPQGTEIPRELSPLERFHPSLDPNKFQLDFDENTGRVKVIPRVVEETPVEDPAPVEDVPPVEAPPETLAQAAPTGEVQQLRSELAQAKELLLVMAQAQMQGKSLGEFLGQQPAQPAEPDYSDYDLYEPDQRAAFIRQIKQDVKAEVMREHQPTLEAARRRQEYDTVAMRYGTDPNFQQKAVAAIQLVEKNRALTIEAAYETVNQIFQSLAPQQVAQPAAAPAQGANPAQRTTLTPEQQQQKAEQARALPNQSSGVRGAGMPNLPKHIKGLGNIRAWVAQQAQLGNL